jgi:hypothetical protein
VCPGSGYGRRLKSGSDTQVRRERSSLERHPLFDLASRGVDIHAEREPIGQRRKSSTGVARPAFVERLPNPKS